MSSAGVGAAEGGDGPDGGGPDGGGRGGSIEGGGSGGGRGDVGAATALADKEDPCQEEPGQALAEPEVPEVPLHPPGLQRLQTLAKLQTGSLRLRREEVVKLLVEVPPPYAAAESAGCHDGGLGDV